MNNLPTYTTKQERSPYKLQYFFESTGNQSIIKVIEYAVIDIIGNRSVFNLGFGDYDEITGTVLDDVTSNNGDMYTVFNTVLATIPEFFSAFPDAVIMVGGSDSHIEFRNSCMLTCTKKCDDDCKNEKRRIRIYRYYVDRNFEDLCVDYIFFGRNKDTSNTFVQYIPNVDYDEILVYKKKSFTFTY